MYNTERILVSRNDKFINTERICIVLINIRIRPERRDDRGKVINLEY